MSPFLRSLIRVSAIAAVATNAMAMGEIELHNRFSISPDVLTNERMIQVDPIEPNPHRMRWALERRVELSGLKVERGASGQFTIEASSLDAQSSLLLRSQQTKYYLDENDFACTATARSLDQFSTFSLSQKEGEWAARVWIDFLQKNRKELQTKLSSLASSAESMVLMRAREALQQWLRGVDSKYRKAVQAEVESFRKKEFSRLNCDPAVGRRLSIAWRDMVEPPAPLPADMTRPLARVPAKRFNGFYTVKLSVQFMNAELNGRFLIDPLATASVFSPEWMAKQGVDPRRLIAGTQNVLSMTYSLGKKKGPVLQAQKVEAGGVAIPAIEWILGDTFLFDEPKFPSRCCDGILGSDFLREFAVEFDPRDQSGLSLYPRKSFPGRSGWSWEEISFDESGVSKKISDQIRASRDQPIFVDAANGRFWFKSAVPPSIGRRAIDSLKLEFQTDAEGNRQLVVARVFREVRDASSGKPIQRGDIVVKLGSKKAIDLDQSEVDALVRSAKLADIVIAGKSR